MPRKPREIHADVVQLECTEGEANQAWVHATQILLRAKARREARLNAAQEASTEDSSDDTQKE